MSIKKRNERRRLARLRSEHKFVGSLLYEIKSILKEYECEWATDISLILKNFDSHKDKNEEGACFDIDFQREFSYVNVEKEDIKKNKKSHADKPKWAKSLFKKIAMITHPDRVKDSALEDKMSPIFHRASALMESENYDGLLDIASDLGIDVDVDDGVLIEKIQLRIQSMRDKICNIEKTAPWVWGESFGLLDLRVEIVKEILKEKGLTVPDREKIITVIKDIENA